jgi:hypothetical protein
MSSVEVEPNSKRLKKELLTMAGVWRDLDADRLIEEVTASVMNPHPAPS